MKPFLPIFLLALAFAAPAAAQEGPIFTPEATEACLADAADLPARRDCIGMSAAGCMESHASGYSTLGMNLCFGAEVAYWDERLNHAYGKLMTREKARDEEMTSLGVSAPSLAEALREMQRAWIPFRDAACAYDRAQWGDGTGGGPATASCLMYETAEQALRLEIDLEHGME